MSSYNDTPLGDVLIHLAEINDRSYANSQSIDYKELSLGVLDHLLSKGYSKVIYASSSVLYSDKILTPQDEFSAVYPTDIYSSLKLTSEHNVLSHGGIVARISNVYGSQMPATNVISDILGQLNSPYPILLNNVFPVRDFIHIDDVCEAFLRFVVKDVSGVFNVGTSVGTAIGDLAKLLLILAGQPMRSIVSNQLDSPLSCIRLDISKSVEMLELGPPISLSDGLKAVLDHYSTK